MMMRMMIKHFFQPTGNACGPTCLYMVNQYFTGDVDRGFNPYPTIKDISEMCGTDWIVGTPPDRMEVGMKKIGLNYIEYVHTKRSFDLLKNVIDDNNIPILRTITQGVPHWIIVKGYIGFEFFINDPWLGEITYSEKQLDEIWKVRHYQFFEIIDDDNFEQDEEDDD